MNQQVVDNVLSLSRPGKAMEAWRRNAPTQFCITPQGKPSLLCKAICVQFFILNCSVYMVLYQRGMQQCQPHCQTIFHVTKLALGFDLS